MQALLSFDKSPPLSAPLRFFLTAPVFAMLAGILLLVDGPEVLASRWSPLTLAATHLFTLGFMLQVMLGALIQVLPVVAGANLAHPARIASGVHATLTLGTLVLVWAFLFPAPGLLHLAATLLGLAILVFLLTAGRAVFAVPTTSPTIRGLKLAFAGLAMTAGLGVLLALALGSGWSLSLLDWVDLHATWGLGGWSAVLLMTLAYVVVPMFQLTPAYRVRASVWMPVSLALSAAVWTLAVLAQLPWLSGLAAWVMALAGLAFAGMTLVLQRQRRRARPDATLAYWQVACMASAVGLVLWRLSGFALVEDWSPLPLLIGVLIMMGGYGGFITGMLYKIVPFLGWLHLQNLAGPGKPVPAMNKLLSEAAMRGQQRLFFAAFALLTAACVWPEWLARPAGLAFLLAHAALLVNLLKAVRAYRACRASLGQAA
ncbi:MAG: hypothetical protein L6Q40_01705 [Azonexus sp.]|nr:hypothetical protein [Azonexus sp.]